MTRCAEHDGLSARLALTLTVLMSISSLAFADLLISNARVFTGADGTVMEEASILIRADRIVSVSRDPVAAAGARVIDATGNTVLPGLIDTHFHLFFDRRDGETWFPSSDAEAGDYIDERLRGVLEDYLAEGFTSVASPLDFWPNVLEIRDRLASEELRGPRLFIAAPVFTTSGAHAICQGKRWCSERLSVPVADPAEAIEQVRRYITAGADFIVFDGLHGRTSPARGEIVMALSDEARRHDRHILLHGVDAAEVGQFVDWGANGLFTPPRVTRDTGGRLLNREIVAELPVAITLEELQQEEAIRYNIVTMLQNGAVPVFGPDLAGTGIPPGEALMSVAHALVDIGLTPRDVILSATRDAARLLGRDDLGTLEPGNLADLLIVRGDPLANIEAIGEVVLVIRDGRVVSWN